MSTTIAFFDAKPYEKDIFNKVNKDFNFEIKYFDFNITSDNIILSDCADAICVFVNDIISKEIIDKLHECGVKLIALRSSGYNNVDLKAASEKISVARVPAYSPNAVAEHTVALILSLNRKIHKAYWRTRDSNFSLTGLMGFDLYQKHCGVIGTGKIGKTLIKILSGFGMKVLAYDPYPDHDFAKETGCSYVELDELYDKSDIISLNCPLTKETEYMINEESISKMKKGVMIINTGRGKLVKTEDLIDGLKSGKIGHAGLDVYEEEEDLFFEDLSDTLLNDDTLARLLTFNNVIITSHQAFFTSEAMYNIARTTMNNINNFFEGKGEKDFNEICHECHKK